MSRAAWILPIVIACNTTQNPVTSSGTTLFDWEYTRATRPGFAKATVGARTAKDFVVDVKPKRSPPFRVDVHVDVATVDYVEHKENEHHIAPVAIKASVTENTGWQLSGSCREGPNEEHRTPLLMTEECSITGDRVAGTLLKSSSNVGFALHIHGDGTVEPFPGDDVTVTPK